MTIFKVEKIAHNEEHLSKEDCLALHFFFDGREICTVMLAPTKEGFYETHISDLPFDLLNKGFGIEIYRQVFSYCIDNKIRLTSSKSRCEDAERLWNSIRLNEMFEIKNNNERYYLLSKKNELVNVT